MKSNNFFGYQVLLVLQLKKLSFASNSKFLYSLKCLLLSMVLVNSAMAQDCSLNAGIPETICENNPYNLSGSITGSIQSGSIWSQVSGPPVIIGEPGNLNTAVTGMLGGNSYTFRLSAQCFDGSIQFQDVIISVASITTATTGNDISSCPDTSGTLFIQGNDGQNIGETGYWSYVGTNYAGVVINSPNSANTSIELLEVYAGTSTLRWTIKGATLSNGQYCESYSDIDITNYGGRSFVNAGPDQSLDNCYSVSQSTKLSASFGGNNINNQLGTWSFVSGPNNPTISDIHSKSSRISGLIEGTYVLQWAVNGPCFNGSDTMTITVAEATQDITTASVQYKKIKFCDASVVTATLIGSPSEFTGETVQWLQTSGPGVDLPGTPAFISDSSSSTTQVSNLDGSSTYKFSYTISNATTGCENSSTSTIQYSIDPIAITVNNGNDILADCAVKTVDIPFTYTGEGNNSYSIINGPSGSKIIDPTNYENVATSPLSLNFDKVGVYTVLFRRAVGGSLLTGCDEATDVVSVTISSFPTPANAGTGQNLTCNATATSLTGNTAAIGTSLWSQIDGPDTATISDPYSRTTTVSNLKPGLYTFRYSISGGIQCNPPEQSDVTISVPSSIVAYTDAGQDKEVCFGTQVQLNANNPTANNHIGTWSVVSAPSGSTIVFENQNDPNSIVTGLNTPSEAYTFKWTIANPNNATCPYPSDDTVTLTTNDIMGSNVADAGLDQCLPSGTTLINLAANEPSANETGTWTAEPSTGISFTNANQFNTAATINQEQSYILTWTLDNCQTSTDEVEITIGDAVANAGLDQSICSDSISMSATTSTGTGLWTLISGPGGYTFDDSTDPNAVINFTFSGQYIFEWTVSNGNCFIVSDQITIDVGIPGTIAVVGSPGAICNATEVTLSGNTYDNNVETGVWTLLSGAPNTPNIIDVNDPNTKVTGLVSGTYTFRWTISGNSHCLPTFADSSIDIFVPANAGPDQYLCESTYLFLEATFGSTGTWSQIDGPGINGNPGTAALIVQSPANGNTADVTITSGNTYVFEFTTAYNSCGSTSDQVSVVTKNGSSAHPYAGIDQTICNAGSNTSTTLNGNNALVAGFDTTITGNEAFWQFASVPNGSNAIIDNPTQYDSSLDNLTVPGIYILEWSFSTENCTIESDAVRIEVFEPVVANAGTDQASACQINARLNAVDPQIGVGEWTITTDPSNGDIVINSPNSGISTLSNITTLGTYIFTWTVNNGAFGSGNCGPDSDTVEVTFTDNIPDIADAGPDQKFCDVSETNLDATALGSGIGTWSQTAGPGVTTAGVSANIITVNDPKTLVQNIEPGNYEFTWTSVSGGCSFYDTVEIEIFASNIIANAGLDQTLNEFSIATLEATPLTVGTGIWSQVSGPTSVIFLNPTDANTPIIGTTAGVYIFEWTVSNGVCPSVSDQVEITFTGSADLELSKNVFPTEANQGDIITFTISIFNNDSNGSGDATGVSVIDLIPEGYNIVNGTISDNGIYNANNRSILWTNLNIENGITYDLTFQAVVNQTEDYYGIAEIIASDQPDRDSNVNNHQVEEDDQDSTVINLIKVDLELNKVVSQIDVNVGDIVTFIISIFNNPTIENGNATGVSLLDQLPTGLTLVPESVSDHGLYNPDNLTLEWNNLSIPNGNVLNFTYDAIVKDTGTYSNVTEIMALDQKDSDSSPNNDDGDQSEDDEDSAYVIPLTTDIALTKNVNNAAPAAGEIIIFTISASNIGDSKATNIGINEILPSGYEFIESNTSHGSYDEASGFWNIQSIDIGIIATLEIQVKVLKNGDYLNRVNLVFVDQIDLNISNDKAEATVAPTCVKVYNQFSPNDDGVNDVLIIDCLSGYPNNFLKIYDRDGNTVFEQHGYSNNWSGISNGKTKVDSGEKLPIGTYFYSLDLGNGSPPIVDWLYIKH